MLCPFPAGELVSFNLHISNTGNLKLKEVTLNVPGIISDNITCSIGTADFVNTSSVLEPGTKLDCTASYPVTTADVEAAPQDVAVVVTATSVLGGVITADKSVTLSPTQSPELGVQVTSCSSVPTKSGEAA